MYRRLEEVTGEGHDTFWERKFEQIGDWQTCRKAANTFGAQLRAAAQDGSGAPPRRWCGRRI